MSSEIENSTNEYDADNIIMMYIQCEAFTALESEYKQSNENEIFYYKKIMKDDLPVKKKILLFQINTQYIYTFYKTDLLYHIIFINTFYVHYHKL